MKSRVVPFLIAFIATVLVVSTVVSLGRKLSATNPSLTVYTHGHDAEARQALTQAGTPGLHFVDTRRPIPHEFLLSSVAAIPLVGFLLGIFFGVFYLMRFLLKPPSI